MKSTFRTGLAAVTVAFAVALAMPPTPARTQDRGTSVIVTNTPADPVPARIVNPDPVSTRPSNDPGRPLFIAPGDRATFNVCPASCGAFQVSGLDQTSDDDLSFDLDVPAGMRFHIRYLTVTAIKASPTGSVRVWLNLANFLPDQTLSHHSAYLTVSLQGVFSGYRHFHASLPVQFHHDANPSSPLRVFGKQTGHFSNNDHFTVHLMASGNLEPLP